MSENDLLMLRTFVQAYGLSEVLCGLASVCSAISLEMANYDAHHANAWMSHSVQLDGLAVEIEELVS